MYKRRPSPERTECEFKSNIRAAYVHVMPFSLSVRIHRARCDTAALQDMPAASGSRRDAIGRVSRPPGADQDSRVDYGIECQTARIWIRAPDGST